MTWNIYNLQGGSNHTIWSLMVFPSCSTVRIFYPKKDTIIRLSVLVCLYDISIGCDTNKTYVNFTYKINSYGADITLNIWIILDRNMKKKINKYKANKEICIHFHNLMRTPSRSLQQISREDTICQHQNLQ